MEKSSHFKTINFSLEFLRKYNEVEKLHFKIRISIDMLTRKKILMSELLKWREEFPILDKTVYLINNSLGAMPNTVYDNLKTYADIWATRGVRAWHEGWWEFIGDIGNILGDIINAPKDTVSMHQNVTIAESVILSCFDFKGGKNKIVYSDMNFPSVMYLYQSRVRDGAEIEMVKSDDGITVATEKMIDAINERTLLVPISHVLFKSAYIQDATAIIEKAHSCGAYVILDTYQSVICIFL